MTKLDEQYFDIGDEEGNRRAPYQPPVLVGLGDVRNITLGASAGADESGLPNTFRR